MRIEDLDADRAKPEASAELLELFEWLGLEYDESPSFQSHDLAPYRHAAGLLASHGKAYSCRLTRAQIRQSLSAPHVGDQELRCPPELRPSDPAAFAFDREDTNYRLMTPDAAIEIDDQFGGRSVHHPSREVGDFVIWTKTGAPSYQLAVVVDDARQGITDVVRGDDLLPSAARQTLLYRALGLPPPNWWHLPLVLGPDGRRLAKRDATHHAASYRRAGVAPQRVIGVLAKWCGICEVPTEMSAEDFRRSFRLDRLSKGPITFTEHEHTWLLGE